MSDLKQNYFILQGYNKGKWRIGTHLLLCTEFPKCDDSNREDFIKCGSQWSAQPGEKRDICVLKLVSNNMYEQCCSFPDLYIIISTVNTQHL